MRILKTPKTSASRRGAPEASPFYCGSILAIRTYSAHLTRSFAMRSSTALAPPNRGSALVVSAKNFFVSSDAANCSIHPASFWMMAAGVPAGTWTDHQIRQRAAAASRRNHQRS